MIFQGGATQLGALQVGGREIGHLLHILKIQKPGATGAGLAKPILKIDGWAASKKGFSVSVLAGLLNDLCPACHFFLNELTMPCRRQSIIADQSEA